MMVSEAKKFKVGDRVRRISYLNSEEMKIGDTGTVTKVDADGDCRVKPDKGGDDQFNFAKYLELVAAWKPNIGDRVVSDDEDARGEVGTVVEGGDNYEGLTMVKFDTWRRGHDGVNLYGNNGKEHWLIQTKDLQPAPPAAPATLTISAGRYYKTRDGRKVGPIVVAQRRDDPWPWKLASGTHYYRNDGHSCPGYADGHRDAVDLIAEWVDEPATIAKDNAAPAKFKVGDRVTGTAPGRGIITGKIVQVDIHDDDMTYSVLPDGSEYPLWAYNNTIELVSSPTAIVALIEDGVAKPATRPVVHTTEEAAKREADRLAGIHKGQQFGVYVLSAASQEEKPTYEHEWQRLAADGKKINAIKELRSITGMGLKPAKDVVEGFIGYPYGAAA
jgi:ribosomal protein L7/L12